MQLKLSYYYKQLTDYGGNMDSITLRQRDYDYLGTVDGFSEPVEGLFVRKDDSRFHVLVPGKNGTVEIEIIARK
jgi:hypothetical protein